MRCCYHHQLELAQGVAVATQPHYQHFTANGVTYHICKQRWKTAQDTLERGQPAGISQERLNYLTLEGPQLPLQMLVSLDIQHVVPSDVTILSWQLV